MAGASDTKTTQLAGVSIGAITKVASAFITVGKNMVRHFKTVMLMH